MKKILFFIICFTFLVSCKKGLNKVNSSLTHIENLEISDKDEQNDLKFKSFLDSILNINLPFSSSSLTKFIVFDYTYNNEKVDVNIELKHDKLRLLKSTKNFISNKKRVAFKKTKNSEYQKGDIFYPVGKFRKDTINFVMFLYQDFEDIMPSIVTQLNSYDSLGRILDTIVLDKKFHYELIYSNNFNIINNQIKINKTVISYYNDKDNLIKNDNPKIKNEGENYFINKRGEFRINNMSVENGK